MERVRFVGWAAVQKDEIERSYDSLLGVVVLPLLREVRGRFGRKGETDEKHASPDELDGDWDPPSDVTRVVLHSVVGSVAEEDTLKKREYENKDDQH